MVDNQALCSLSDREQRTFARSQRKQIQGAEREQKSQRATDILLQSALFDEAEHIALFLSLPEEIDTKYLVKALWQRGKALYLPYTQAKDCPLLWLAYTAQSLLVADGLGILAPLWEEKALWKAEQLDLVVTPLVGWDLSGNRLGMGGGFYDRTFAPSALPNPAPKRVGLAYECQRLPKIQKKRFDLPLHYLATEQHFYSFNNPTL